MPSFLSVGDGLRVCGHRGRAPLFAYLPRRRSPRKARRRRLDLALRGVRLSGIPRPVGGRSPRSPWQGGRTISFPLALLLFRSRTFRGANSGHPAPISMTAAARVGRTAFRFCPPCRVGAGACFTKGLLLPAGAYAQGAGANAEPHLWRSTGPQARSTGPSLPRPPPRGAAQRAAEHRLNLGPRGDARPQAGF